MKKIKVGLLPLYIKLYDDNTPERRPTIEAFRDLISQKLAEAGIDVITAPVCRIEPEFEEAVANFEKEGADAIVTLHLAYSPSLESARVLANTKLPIVVLDTTPDYAFNGFTPPRALSFNHGIHGVQDMCNLLRRNGKAFEIVAGHWKKSDVIMRAVNTLKAAVMANKLKSSRIGIIGDPFKGMGDFQLPYEDFRKYIGFETVQYSEKDVYRPTKAEVDEEYSSDCARFVNKDVSEELYDEVTETCISVRKWIEREKLDGFTMNFFNSAKNSYFPKLPFSEASKAMERGIGYAGEGDVLTAAMNGALMSVYPRTSFCEMFCPDWEGDRVYLSHMGEFNLSCSEGKLSMSRMEFTYTDAGDTFSVYGSFMRGKTIFVCLAPQKDGKFTLIAAPGEMRGTYPDPLVNTHSHEINGWFEPRIPITDFLEEYSRAGGIHHANLVWDGDTEVIRSFAAYMGWDFKLIQ